MYLPIWFLMYKIVPKKAGPPPIFVDVNSLCIHNDANFPSSAWDVKMPGPLYYRRMRKGRASSARGLLCSRRRARLFRYKAEADCWALSHHRVKYVPSKSRLPVPLFTWKASWTLFYSHHVNCEDLNPNPTGYGSIWLAELFWMAKLYIFIRMFFVMLHQV